MPRSFFVITILLAASSTAVSSNLICLNSNLSLFKDKQSIPARFKSEVKEKIAAHLGWFEGQEASDVKLYWLRKSSVSNEIPSNSKIYYLGHGDRGDIYLIKPNRAENYVIKAYKEGWHQHRNRDLKTMTILQELTNDKIDTGFKILKVKPARGEPHWLKQEYTKGVQLNRVIYSVAPFEANPISPELHDYLMKSYDKKAKLLIKAMKSKGWEVGYVRTMDDFWHISVRRPYGSSRKGFEHITFRIKLDSIFMDPETLEMTFIDPD